MQPRIDLIYVDSGGGHRAAAAALCKVFDEQALPWDVRMVCIQDLLAPIDIIRKATGTPSQEIYNILLRHGWTAGSDHMIRAMHLLIRAFHSRQVRVLAEYWSARMPDLVVSLIPHFNRAIKDSLDRVDGRIPLITILTDIADFPPHFWIEPQDQFVICGSDRAVRQACQIGVPLHKVLRVSGMILHPRFYQSHQPDRALERVRLGLHPDLPTGLVLFGGEGSMEMIEIARALNRKDAGIQLILLCGRNETTRRAVESMSRHIPMLVEGFTKDVPSYMELSDFFIGKPGPGCMSEAIAKGLPIIVRRDRMTLAHERYNCEWLEEEGFGIIVNGYSPLQDAVKELLRPERYAECRARLSAVRNRAVYEIPRMLERILLDSSPRPGLESSHLSALNTASAQ